MKILGIGIDIEDISRFSKLPFEKNKNFYEKIFTEKEIKYCMKKTNPSQHFAVRFCAKEAFVKALGKNIKNLKSIEVKMDDNKPTIIFPGLTIFLSMAHEKNKAIAFAIITKNNFLL